MKLDKLKQIKDEGYMITCLKTVDIIKSICKIDKQLYMLHYWGNRNYYLSDNSVYIARFDYKEETPKLKSLYKLDLKIKKLSTIIKDIEEDYTIDLFEIWYNSPSQINLDVNVTYKKIIKFLQANKTNSFNYGEYQFFIKQDNDLTWTFNIYAKNIKTGITVKIYVDDFINYQAPKTIKNIIIDDLGNKISNYQTTKLKKKFLEFCNLNCEELCSNNFYVMEFVKQTIQPIDKDCGWFIRNVFYEEDNKYNIWVDDFLGYDKKPYFLIGNSLNNITKVAVLDFFEPKYKTTSIYISGCYKRNFWQLDKNVIEKLINFLNKPFGYKNTIYYKKSRKWYKDFNYTDDDIKTNWQWLISEYNDNTGYVHEELVPLDLPIPNYTKLLDDKVETQVIKQN